MCVVLADATAESRGKNADFPGLRCAASRLQPRVRSD